MKINLLSKRIVLRLCYFLFVFVTFFACKKDLYDSEQNSIKLDKIKAAKLWFEKHHTALKQNAALTKLMSLPNSQVRSSFLNQLNPDWEKGKSFTRLNEDVVEVEIKESDRFCAAFKKEVAGNDLFKKEYSRSSFLFIRNGSEFSTYIMIIIADSSYVRGDLKKLSHNTYRKHDPNFSGIVLYFTIDGRFLSSWRYEDGKILRKAPLQVRAPLLDSNSAGVTTSSIGQDPIRIICHDYYVETYTNGRLTDTQYLFTECESIGGSSGAGADEGDNSGGTYTPTAPCKSPEPSRDLIHKE